MLSGCGGGGGGGSSGESIKSAQGFWSGSVASGPDGANSLNAVVAPSESAWIVFQNGSTPTALAKVRMTTTATVSGAQANSIGTGFYFKIGTTTRQAMTLSGVVTTGNTFSGSADLATTPASTFTWSMTGSPAYSTPAQTSSLVASWSGSVGGASVTTTWTINSSGVVTGTSSTGCTYSGSISPNSAAVAIFDAAITENCGGAIETFSGIATLNSTKTVLSIAHTTAADAKASLLQLSKL